jgi:hypothetical protein
MTSDALDPATLDMLAENEEVDMRTPRRDGSVASRPIWVVVTGGEAYVRSYRGPRGAWYRRALADGKAAVGVGGSVVDVGVEPAADEAVNARVSDAFRAKYGERHPGSTDAMVEPPEVVATTLRLTRA